MLNASDGIIAVSHALRGATAALGVPPDKIQVIPDGVDLKKFYPIPEQRAPIILYVGSLIKIKGVNYLIESLPQVVQQFPDYRLVIIGDGPELPFLKSLGEKLGITQAIVFMGSQTPAQVQAWMQQAKLLVLPSLEEGLGVVLLEALACGTPCVGTSVGGIPDVITPEVGRLVPPADPAALAEAILRVLAEPDHWTFLSRNARQRVEQQFDWNIIAQKIIQVYQQVLRPRT
jgi:glycosyltransferase involved in cell wall biosynthesis